MRVERRATSPAPPEQVWAVLADLDAWPELLSTVDTLEREDPDAPHGVGAAYLVKQPRLPKARWVIQEWLPGSSFTWTSSGPGVLTTATHQLRATAEGGTEIVLGIEWSGVLGSVLGLMYRRLAGRYIDTEIATMAERAAV